jgi:predicted ABC-type ATPase
VSPRLDLVVGSNGAGKSTLVGLHLQPRLRTPFVNADEIAKQRWPYAAERHSYEAARIAADSRDALISAGRSFIAETVFSHPSKLELIDRAHEHGYRVILHAVLIPEELAVHRVRLRITGGATPYPRTRSANATGACGHSFGQRFTAATTQPSTQ